jgi:dimethylargininase
MLAIVQPPSPLLNEGERTHVERTPIDFTRAVRQHRAYCSLLQECGCTVRVVHANAHRPDGVFIEDTAVVLDEVAILGSMGAASRRLETAAIEPILSEYGPVRRIEPPATLEGGDVLRVGRTLLAGLSGRTNADGIESLAGHARRFGYEVRAVPVRGCLHLKTACTALPDGRLLVNPAWVDVPSLHGYHLVEVDASEPFAANVLLAGETVVMAEGHPRTEARVRALGFKVRTVDISELGKAEGGVTCLSLPISHP